MCGQRRLTRIAPLSLSLSLCVCQARCLATLAAADPDAALPALLRAVRASMADLSAPTARTGSMLTLRELIQQHPPQVRPELMMTVRFDFFTSLFPIPNVLGSYFRPQLLPYAVLLLVPLMGAMSDPLKSIRTAAAQSFAALVPLLPLARCGGATVSHPSFLGWQLPAS
jgi:hypothetical protein